MIRCNGSSSGGKTILGARTPAGGAAPPAERERPCCGASASIAAKQTSRLSLSSRRCLIGTPIGIAEMTAQTWTFSERTKDKWNSNLNR
jgi:hypothetical protein